MRRRSFVCTFVGGSLLSAGCLGAVSSSSDPPESSAVFDEYRYEGRDLVVTFRDGVEIEKVVLRDSPADRKYEVVDRPGKEVRFTVVFPDRMESYVSRSLRVDAKTADGWVDEGVWEPVHAVPREIYVEPDGRVRFDIENSGYAPLLIRFVGIYGDVPNPPVDPRSDSFDRETFELGPSVIGTERNRPLDPSRADLVVPGKETSQFETTYAPFAFTGDGTDLGCNGTERRAKISIVQQSRKVISSSFTYTADGGKVSTEGIASEATDSKDHSVCRSYRTNWD